MSVGTDDAGAPAPSRGGHVTAIVAIVAAGLAMNVAAAIAIIATHPVPAYPWPLIAVAVPTLFVGALICVRKPSETIGWLLLWIGFAMSAMILLGEYAMYSVYGRSSSLPLTGAAAWVSSVLQASAIFAILVVLVVYPTGRLLSPRWRWLSWAVVIAGMTAFGVTAFSWPTFDSNLDTIRNPLGLAHPPTVLVLLAAVGNAVTFLALGGAVVQLILRLVRSRGDEREQLKWFVYVAIVGPIALWVVPSLVPHDWEQWVGNVVWTLVPIALIASIAVAILRYRLYDIDVVIRKTLVFGVLAAFVTAVYAIVVAGFGAVAGRAGPALSFAAAVLVAVAFQPVRDRARRLADRLVYGRRATPYEVLTEFSAQVSDAVSTDDVLPRLARVVAQGMGVRRARVWLRVAGAYVPAASWPQENGDRPEIVPASGDELPALPATESFAVANAGTVLGAIAVDADPADPLTPARSKLARDVAAQAGLILRNVQLVEDLRASRQRIVSAQDEERRRIQRSLQAGAERHLAGLDELLGRAEATAADEAPPAVPAVRDLRTGVDRAVANLRALAGGVYPPLLEAEGVVAALGEQAGASVVPTTIDAQDLGRFPLEVEAAVYFCALEAMQNAAKYADASRVVVRLRSSDGELAFEVTDDGRGFDPATHGYGTGLQGIADRLATIGGRLHVRSRPGAGTTVAGSVHAAPDAVTA
ncbi:MAG TPA: ATP-binding protein [Actinomycetota bacterium]